MPKEKGKKLVKVIRSDSGGYGGVDEKGNKNCIPDDAIKDALVSEEGER